MRTPIQIAAFGVKRTERTQTNYVVVALCDDGTIWEYGDERGAWQKYDPIPQDPEPKSEDVPW